MDATPYYSEVVMNNETRLHRAEVYELPDRELVLAGPWCKTPQKAREAASQAVRKILYAIQGVTP